MRRAFLFPQLRHIQNKIEHRKNISYDILSLCPNFDVILTNKRELEIQQTTMKTPVYRLCDDRDSVA